MQVLRIDQTQFEPLQRGLICTDLITPADNVSVAFSVSIDYLRRSFGVIGIESTIRSPFRDDLDVLGLT